MPATTPSIASGAKLADGVLVINLDHRPERLERFAAMAEGLPHLAGWQRLPAVNGLELPGYGQTPWFRGGKRDKCWAGRAGCTLSHRHAIARAKMEGWDSVLILEDDALPGAAFTAEAADFTNRMAGRVPPWSICYLGWSRPSGPARKWLDLDHQRSLCGIYGCFGTFAYIIRREAFEWTLAGLPTVATIWPWIARYRAVDRWYSRYLSGRFGVCAVSPSLVGHYASFSDIGQRGGATITACASGDEPAATLRATGAARFAVASATRRLFQRLTEPVHALRAARKRSGGF